MTALDGRTALVTGAGRGIGRGIAASLAEAGANVVLGDIDRAAAEDAAADLDDRGHSAIAHEMDVRAPTSVEAAIAVATQHFGGLDIAVANAGRTDRQPFLEMDQGFFQEIIRLNLEGTFITCQAAARAMAQQGRGGRIITISSNSGVFGGRGRAAYSPSKAGIIALTQTMAVELADHGILVNCIAPGPIRTERSTADVPSEAFIARMALPRFGEPREVGAAAVFLASDAASFTTGHVIGVDGGLTVTGIMEG